MPIYEKLVTAVRERIQRGELAPGAMLGTEIGLASEFGISRNSVRTAVDALVAEGLVVREAGRGLFVKAGGTMQVAVVVPSLGGIWVDLVAGAQVEARRLGTRWQVRCADGDLETDLALVRELPRLGVQGAVIGSLHHPRLNAAIINLWHDGFPFVLADQSFADVELPAVVFDNQAAGALAARELLAAGHRRIGFIGYESTARGDRLDGLRETLGEAGLPWRRADSVLAPLTQLVATPEEFFAAPLRRLLARRDRPTALLCHHHDIALLALRLAREAGLVVPHDLSVVSFGDRPLAQALHPVLAMVETSGDAMGRAALAMLMERIADPAAPVRQERLPCAWLPGGTIGRRPATEQ